MDPEIFINQKILKTYVPTAEPMAAVFFVTRKIKKFDIKLIVEREIQKAESLFREKVKSGITQSEIEEAKINFAQPSNLFHCLWLKTIPGNLSFGKRLDFIVNLYEKLMSKYLSFYNREVIRENFIIGVQETIVLLRTSNFNESELNIKSQKSNNDPILKQREVGSNKEAVVKLPVLTIKKLFNNDSLYPTVIKKMTELNVLDEKGRLNSIRGNKTKLNLVILHLQSLNVIETEGITSEGIVNTLKNNFGDSSNSQHYAKMKADFNSENLSADNYRFIEKLKNIS